MKNPIATVQEAYANHKTTIVYGAGIATGLAAMVLVRRNFIPVIETTIEPQLLQTVIDDPTAVMTYVDKHAVVRLINSTNPDLKQ